MSNYNEDIQKWAEITIERWQQRIRKFKVYNTFALLNSFQSHVETSSNGDPEKIVFTYMYYGMFPQLGVGKGVKLGMPSNRVKKPWFNDVINKEIRILAFKTAERYGKEVVSAIKVIELINKQNND